MSAPVSRTRLALKSLWSRRVAVGLTVLGVGLSVAMILAVERIRLESGSFYQVARSGGRDCVPPRT